MPETERAKAAATAVVRSLGLLADHAVVLQSANRVTVRLLPCDVVARVAPADDRAVGLELALAQQLGAAGAPVALPDPRVEPRVHQREDFAITLWAYYEPAPVLDDDPARYAAALAQLHAGMRTVDLETPHVSDRVAEARRLVASHEDTPALSAAGRDLLGEALRLGRRLDPGGGAEQLLHGEPHPGNLLITREGLLFTDFETACRGPVEFDLAHAPDEVAEHYPGVDRDLLRTCRIVMTALVAAWRWDRRDTFPDGHRFGTEWLGRLRTQLGR